MIFMLLILSNQLQKLDDRLKQANSATKPDIADFLQQKYIFIKI